LTTAALPASSLLRRERLWPTVLVSLLVHVAAIAFLFIGRPPPPLDLGQQPIRVRPVRLGEKRPDHFLPRKQEGAPPKAPVAAPIATAPRPTPPTPAPPAPPAPSKVVAGAAPTTAKPAPAAATRGTAAGSTTGGRDALARVISRFENEAPPEGSPDGDPLGTESDGDVGDVYLAQVTRALQETYNLPSTISERERMYLKATVLLFIEPDGRVSRWQFAQRSQNPVFDGALERAIQAARVPPPPAEMAQRYRTQGLAVLYRP
jgi:colicin import membrane protein/protein TonB